MTDHLIDRSAGIERLAGEIQKLPAFIRWLHAQPDVILALTCKKPLARGPRMQWIDRWVWLTSSLGIARSSAAAVSFAMLAMIYVRQFTVAQRPPDRARALFIGIDALREPGLIRQLEQLCGGSVDTLNLFDFRMFSCRRRIGIVALLTEWFCVWREIWPELAGISAGTATRGIPRAYRFAQVLALGNRYTYMRAWFRAHVRADPKNNTIAFSTADDVAYAGVAAGARAIYFVHGFLVHSLIFPDFSEIHCFTRFEQEHLRRRLPDARVIFVPPPFNPIAVRRLLVIIGGYLEYQQSDPCDSLVEWARSNNVSVVVRIHPKDRSGYWTRFRGQAGVEVEGASENFETFLATHRPRFLASWVSTALFDALAHGVVPLTLLQEPVLSADVVVPLRDIAIRWPEQRDLLDRILNAPEMAADFAAQKFHNAIGVALPERGAEE